jgi:hypothetical protein
MVNCTAVVVLLPGTTQVLHLWPAADAVAAAAAALPLSLLLLLLLLLRYL